MISLTQIHQIEITSRCNLKCHYCVHRSMARPKIDMSIETYEKALGWAKWFKDRGTQGSINLAGIGESTMHEDFLKYLKLAREIMGPKQEFVLATNGLEIAKNPELAQGMFEALSGWYKESEADTRYQPKIFVSLHRPEKGGPAVEALKKVGLIAGVSVDAAVSATDWAGQIKWHRSAQPTACPWVRGGWGVVLSDGRISRCSFDGSGIGVLAHVDDDLRLAQTSPYSLCKTFHQDVGLPLDDVA